MILFSTLRHCPPIPASCSELLQVQAFASKPVTFPKSSCFLEQLPEKQTAYLDSMETLNQSCSSFMPPESEVAACGYQQSLELEFCMSCFRF